MRKLDYLLELKNITKRYPSVMALNNISVGFQEGEVHALLGENGAGKSTLIKVLSGAIQPDSGEIIVDGVTYTNMTPAQAQKLGIGVIYQEFNLVPSMSVAENIFLGNEIRKGIRIDRKKMQQAALEVLKRLEIKIDPAKPVRELSVAYQQIVEIAKAISKNVRVLVMDEPTAPLTINEVDALFGLVRRLVAQRVTIIYISHRIEELFEISDRITILRDGHYIETQETPSATKDGLIRLMVGRPLVEQYPKRSFQPGQTMLEVRNVSSKDFLKDISFSLRKGEILGISGLVGAGRTELARAIFGVDDIISGEILFDGQPLRITTENCSKKGIGYIPEDRKLSGLFLNLTVRENITISTLSQTSSGGIINGKKEKEALTKQISALSIKTPSINQKINNLSGGNQQKCIIARWLFKDNLKLLIVDEPTRGIDVGAKQEIYNILDRLAGQGVAVMIMSSEMPELMKMSDRVVVLKDGSVTAVLEKQDIDQETMMKYAVM